MSGLLSLVRGAGAVLLLPAAGLALVGVYLVVETLAPATLTEAPAASMAEAVARGNPAHALEMMAAGADIDAPGLVPAGTIDRNSYVFTPLEAAIVARRTESVRLLLASGANPFSTPLDVACLARLRLPDVLEALGEVPGDPEQEPAAVGDALEACVRQGVGAPAGAP